MIAPRKPQESRLVRHGVWLWLAAVTWLSASYAYMPDLAPPLSLVLLVSGLLLGVTQMLVALARWEAGYFVKAAAMAAVAFIFLFPGDLARTLGAELRLALNRERYLEHVAAFRSGLTPECRCRADRAPLRVVFLWHDLADGIYGAAYDPAGVLEEGAPGFGGTLIHVERRGQDWALVAVSEAPPR